MRLFVATLGVALALACSAAPALSMPAHDSRSDSVVRSQEAVEPITNSPAVEAAGTGALVVVLIGAGALLAGAGVGFAAGHRRELRTTA